MLSSTSSVMFKLDFTAGDRQVTDMLKGTNAIDSFRHAD